MREVAVQCVLWDSHASAEQGKGHLWADNGGHLEEMLLRRWQPVEPGLNKPLNEGREGHAGCRRDRIYLALDREQPVRLQGAHQFFREEWVAPCARVEDTKISRTSEERRKRTRKAS